MYETEDEDLMKKSLLNRFYCIFFGGSKQRMMIFELLLFGGGKNLYIYTA
jgi:hypothetical protein